MLLQGKKKSIPLWLPQDTVLVAGAGADKKFKSASSGLGVVQQSEKNAGVGTGGVPAEVEDQLLGVGAGAVSDHQTR